MAWIETRYRKDGGVETKEELYYVYYRINGKKQSPICAGPIWKTAEDLKRQIEDRDIRKQNGLSLTNNITLGEAIDKYLGEWKSAGGNESTQYHYCLYLTDFKTYIGADRKLATIWRQDILDFRNALCAEHEVNGIHTIIRIVAAFFSNCVTLEMLSHSPCIKILSDKKFKKRKVARFYTPRECRTLIDACVLKRGPRKGADLQDIVRVALLTGMREGEIAVLRKSWIQNGFIKLPWEMTKSDKPRNIPIHDKYLLNILETRMEKNDSIFPGWSGHDIAQAWGRRIESAKKEKLIDGRCRFHDLRHTFASNYLEGGGDMATLKVLLGHSSISTTDIYSHINPKRLREEVNSMRNEFMEPEEPILAVMR